VWIAAPLLHLPARGHALRARTARVRAWTIGWALLACSLGHAGSLGTIGPAYPIAERNLLDHIMARLREKERSGELAKFELLARARASDSVLHPKPVPGLRLADAPRTYYFDPSFTLDRNIVDTSGAVLFAAGLRKNPLEVVSLSRHLLFFDARDARQVAKARELIVRYQGRVKPILVGGSYIDLMKAWNTPVYYDQEGTLVRKLGITGVPAIVSQEGSRLRIDEVSVR
jgi:conjugal transfer pilus assembly protein TraW